MNAKSVLAELKKHSNPKNVEGMARFGINSKNTLGVPVPVLRGMAKKIGKDHKLALELWSSGVHEARILAGMIDDPKLVSGKQADSWAREFDSWDVCDQTSMNLFKFLPFAYEKAKEWADEDEEFVRRAGFALMACLGWGDKGAKDGQLEAFFPLIKKHSVDGRNFVRKAVNWALRQIGKRNKKLNASAIKLAREIQKLDSKSAKWIASDALRELESEKVKEKLGARKVV